MSSRAPVGASSRLDLFTSARNNESKNNEGSEEPVPNDVNSPLQLEHILGSSSGKSTLVCSPINENIFIRSLGNLVSIEDLNDPHSQRILRGHDMPVSALAISPSGGLIASGQIGTKNFKGKSAPIFIWRIVDGLRVSILKGLTERVNLIAFSTDERFVCACGEDCLLYIWDLVTSEVIFGQTLANSGSVLRWVEHKKVGQYMTYELIVGLGNSLYKCPLTYEPMRVQWGMKMIPFALPPGGGIIRSFNCIDISRDGVFVFVGTSGGEVMVYRRDTSVFRCCVPVCSNGVNSVIYMPNDDIICCGGDGTIKRIQGRDMAWKMVHERLIESPIKTAVLSSNESEVVLNCVSGSIHRCLLSNFNNAVVTVGHTGSVACVAFNYDKNFQSNFFATGSSSGEVRVWDISDYACIAVSRNNQNGALLSICIFKNDSIITGWEDGFIRCHDLATLNRQLWYIPNAHRAGIQSIAYYLDRSLEYMVSGGNDGIVRIWRLSNRELVTEHSEHGRSSCKVLVDTKVPSIIHSCGSNGTIVSYDLKVNRKIIAHAVSSGCSIFDISQRKDSEFEVVTCDSLGRLLQWDIDYRDPVTAMQDPSRQAIRSCSVSPSGLYLAFAGDDSLLKILNIQNGDVISIGQGHSDSINSLAWTPDEKQIITAGKDGCLCIWNFYLAKV